MKFGNDRAEANRRTTRRLMVHWPTTMDLFLRMAVSFNVLTLKALLVLAKPAKRLARFSQRQTCGFFDF